MSSYSIVIPLESRKVTAEQVAVEIKNRTGYECDVVEDHSAGAGSYAPLQAGSAQ